MRHHFTFLTIVSVVLFSATPLNAGKPDKLIGLSEEELLSCAGIPTAQMASGATTFFQYGEFSERGAFVPLGNTLFLAKKHKGCQAVVMLRSSRVIKVTYKTKGLISGPLACQRIFSEC